MLSRGMMFAFIIVGWYELPGLVHQAWVRPPQLFSLSEMVC